MLVDAGLRVAALYDAALRLGPIRLVKRTVVGIARDGTVTYYQRGMPSTDEMLAGVGAG